MLAKKRRNPLQTSQQNNIIYYGIFCVLAIALIYALITSELVREHILLLFLGLLFAGIIFIILVMRENGGQQDSMLALQGGGVIKARKDKNSRHHYATINQGVTADGSISSARQRADKNASGKTGKGSFGAKSSSSNRVSSTKARSSPQSKKMQDESEEEKISLPPDEQQDNTRISEDLWNFPKELLDRYEPLGVLGDDAYAQVFMVRNKKEDEIRSLKLSKSIEPASEIAKKESSVWRKMKHPNITTLYTSEFDQFKFLEMEYVPGVLYRGERYLSLSELPKPIKEKYAVSLVLDIAKALSYTHNLGLRHYHLQPGNILVTPKLEAKISGYSRGKNEFGFATGYATIDAHNESDERLAHIAPEQREGSNETLSTRTDLYQLGVIFYELLTGYKPYTKRLYQFVYPNADENQMNNEYDHLFIPPSYIAKRLAPYDAILQQLTAQDKKARYSSIKNFVADLKAVRS